MLLKFIAKKTTKKTKQHTYIYFFREVVLDHEVVTHTNGSHFETREKKEKKKLCEGLCERKKEFRFIKKFVILFLTLVHAYIILIHSLYTSFATR